MELRSKADWARAELFANPDTAMQVLKDIYLESKRLDYDSLVIY